MAPAQDYLRPPFGLLHCDVFGIVNVVGRSLGRGQSARTRKPADQAYYEAAHSSSLPHTTLSDTLPVAHEVHLPDRDLILRCAVGSLTVGSLRLRGMHRAGAR
jgi:hypothetical protein